MTKLYGQKWKFQGKQSHGEEKDGRRWNGRSE